MLRAGLYTLVTLALPSVTEAQGGGWGGWGGRRSPRCKTCGTDPACVQTVSSAGRLLYDAPGISPLENFMPAWKLGRQQFYIYNNLPPAPTRVFFPKQHVPLPVDVTINVVCPCNTENKPCEAILVQYHCPACTANKNGGWPSVLPGLGWRPGSCSPLVSSTPGPIEQAEGWRTLGWRKLIPAGTTDEIPIVGVPLEHVGVFVRLCAVDCAKVDPMAGPVPDECVCDMQGCRSNWCPPRAPDVVTPVPCEMQSGCAPSLL